MYELIRYRRAGTPQGSTLEGPCSAAVYDPLSAVKQILARLLLSTAMLRDELRPQVEPHFITRYLRTPKTIHHRLEFICQPYQTYRGIRIPFALHDWTCIRYTRQTPLLFLDDGPPGIHIWLSLQMQRR